MTTPPKIEPDWALFLDLDGTLIDLASTPKSVLVPKDLSSTLQSVSRMLDGALAIVSGRSIAEIDELLIPVKLPVAGDHGTTVRAHQGIVQHLETMSKFPRPWIDRLRDNIALWPGVFLEEKQRSIAIHFRLAPERANDVFDIAMSLVQQDPEHFRLLQAKSACEILHGSATKGDAVRWFMRNAPFQGRVPVFVGDDVTDHAGMDVARSMGGLGLEVSVNFQDNPGRVRDWLRCSLK